MNVATVMSEMANHAANEPWISLESASWWFDRASWLLAGSLLVGFVCTVVIIWMGFAKEHHWDLAREHAATEIEGTKLEAAKANKEAAIARLEAERIRQRLVWRLIDPEPQRRLIEKLKSFAPQRYSLFFPESDPEASNLARVLRQTLDDAGWRHETLIDPNGIGTVRPSTGIVLQRANGSGSAVGPAMDALSLGLTQEALNIEHVGMISGPEFEGLGPVVAIFVLRKPPSKIDIPPIAHSPE